MKLNLTSYGKRFKNGRSKGAPCLTNMIKNKNVLVYPNECQPFIDIIAESFKSEIKAVDVMWRVRYDSLTLKDSQVYYWRKTDNEIIVDRLEDFFEWLKLVGNVEKTEQGWRVANIDFTIQEQDGFKHIFFSGGKRTDQNRFVACVKRATYCIGCQHCEANCVCGELKFINGKVNIGACKHCGACFPRKKKVGTNSHSCLRFESLRVGANIRSGKTKLEWNNENSKSSVENDGK